MTPLWDSYVSFPFLSGLRREASFSIVSSSGNGGIVDPQVGFPMGYGHSSSFRISLVFLAMSLLQLVRRHCWAFVNLCFNKPSGLCSPGPYRRPFYVAEVPHQFFGVRPCVGYSSL